MVYLVRAQALETGRLDLEYQLYTDEPIITSSLTTISGLVKLKVVPAL